MSSAQTQESKRAMEQNKSLAEGYYGIAIPGLQERMGAINASLGQGEPEYLKSAFQGQRAGLTEGFSARGGAARSQQMEGAKGAMAGGNQFASMHPADVGAQLANALYGSKFQEGQANLGQQFNLISMGLGGAGTSGSGALEASRQQLGAIQFMPAYNQTYANIVGAGALGSSLYGAANQGGMFSGGGSLPVGTSQFNPATGGAFIP